jgi:hypothetical protein
MVTPVAQNVYRRWLVDNELGTTRKQASVVNVKRCVGICLGLRKIKRNLLQNTRCLGQDLNSGHPDFEVQTLPSRPRSSE